MNKKQILEVQKLAKNVRLDVLNQVYNAKSGHIGGSLSIADILSYLYTVELNVDSKNPDDNNRDRFVLSKGHTSPALYSVLAYKGFFDKEELKGFRKVNQKLQGHPEMKKTKGVDVTTGSLGQGLSVAVGLALGGKLSKQSFRVYCIVGDGEIQEGQIWEACMFASNYKLDNLVVIVDNNDLQIDGSLKDVMSPYPIDEKMKAFGFHTINIDAHNINDIDKAFVEARTIKNKPVSIIAKSIKGKGISFMENVVSWHGVAPNEKEYNKALKELNN